MITFIFVVNTYCTDQAPLGPFEPQSNQQNHVVFIVIVVIVIVIVIIIIIIIIIFICSNDVTTYRRQYNDTACEQDIPDSYEQH